MKHITQTPWTDEERAMLRRLRANGLGLKAVATMMGRSYHSVTRQVRYLGLQLNLPPKPRPASPEPPKRVRGGASLPPLPSLAEGQDPAG
jgi:transposase